MKEKPNYLLLALFASLTLGLAPFYPEPHIVGKIRWVIGGANGMATMDWLDLCWHGAPWLILIVLLVRKMMKPKVL